MCSLNTMNKHIPLIRLIFGFFCVFCWGQTLWLKFTLIFCLFYLSLFINFSRAFFMWGSSLIWNINMGWQPGSSVQTQKSFFWSGNDKKNMRFIAYYKYFGYISSLGELANLEVVRLVLMSWRPVRPSKMSYLSVSPSKRPGRDQTDYWPHCI